MSEVKGKHSINIRLENEDYEYLQKLADAKSTNVTHLAHDLLRLEIQRERNKRVDGLHINSPPTTQSDPTTPSTTESESPTTNAGAREVSTTKRKRGFFSRLFSKS